MKLIIATVLMVLAVQMNATPVEFSQSIEEQNAIREILCVTRLINTSQRLIRDQVEFFIDVNNRFNSIAELRANCDRLPGNARAICLEANDRLRQAAIAILVAELVQLGSSVPNEIRQTINDFENCRS